jgi:hypothetical protein
MAASSVSTNTRIGKLSLADEVFFCVTEGQGLFLDLRRDDYSAIPLAIGAATRDEPDLHATISKAFETHRQDLLNAHLVEEKVAGREDVLAFQSLVRPRSNIFRPDDQRAFGMARKPGRSVQIGVEDVLDFFLASYRASRLLKRRHIYDVVCSVRLRKAAAEHSADLDALRQHTAIYRKLRPWYPRGYLCLYDGLALIEFLARRRLFPAWVFGVQAQPFGAHCWVQQGDVVLNESTEYAGQFTPIMSV